MSAHLVVYTLCRREIVRFVRQRSRLVGALAQPVLFWLLLV
jgi:ABC-2 type transport system permease protein